MTKKKIEVMTNAEFLQSDYVKDEFLIDEGAVVKMRASCPAKFRFADLESRKNKGMQQGAISHACILSEERFAEEFYRLPDVADYPDCLSTDTSIKSWLKEHGVSGYSKKKGQQLINMVREVDQKVVIFPEIESAAAELNGNRIPVSPKEYDNAVAMREVLFQNGFKDLINGAQSNVVVVVHCDGYRLKIKADLFHDGKVIDYVTTRDAGPDGFQRHAVTLDYYMKMSLRFDVLRSCDGLDSPVLSAHVLAQESEMPYLPMMYDLDDRHLTIGRIRYRESLSMFKQCFNNEVWPGYNGGQKNMILPIPEYHYRLYKDYIEQQKPSE